MIRRNFIQKLSGAGAVGIASAAAEQPASVSFRVKGFTCIGCAVGVEVMLLKQRGVIKARASYPENKVDIRFDSAQTTPEALKLFINKTTGFTVEQDAA